MVWSLDAVTFDSPQLGKQLKQIYRTLEYRSRDMLTFDFLEKGLGIVSLPQFVYDFSRKMFLKKLTDQISLPDCLYVLKCW